MERFFEFAQNHPLLFISFIACAIAYVVFEISKSGKKISPQQVGLLVANENAKIIDIRPANEFQKGHISGSENIPFSQLDTQLDKLKAITTPIILVCKMGTHASSAFHKIGKPNVVRLDGGILNWESQGLPLLKPKQQKKKKR